jgi:hypothetical protein
MIRHRFVLRQVLVAHPLQRRVLRVHRLCKQRNHVRQIQPLADVPLAEGLEVLHRRGTRCRQSPRRDHELERRIQPGRQRLGGSAAAAAAAILLLLVHLIEIRQRVRVDESHDATQCSARRIAHRDGCSAFVVVIVASSLDRRRQYGRSDAARREARALGGMSAAARERR